MKTRIRTNCVYNLISKLPKTIKGCKHPKFKLASHAGDRYSGWEGEEEDVVSCWVTSKKGEDTGRGSNGSTCVENSLCKWLRTCRKTDCVMMTP